MRLQSHSYNKDKEKIEDINKDKDKEKIFENFVDKLSVCVND
jgi:hypothetical protein